MCEAKFLGIQCNRDHGHEGAHAIGTPREQNKYFPRYTNSEQDMKCPAGCTKDHGRPAWMSHLRAKDYTNA